MEVARVAAKTKNVVARAAAWKKASADYGRGSFSLTRKKMYKM